MRFGAEQMRALFSPGERWTLQRSDVGYRLILQP